ncbi:unnamed protein product (macronuclear) [Paramecium tetraurelia]|uniref:Uncharacterized protein n=1 Tax=Paramecium tetraurelia TaxID=5888 RepID=A0D1P9_PARTE|nr:uncharacterized protein GSPATT00012490001 [Paramecium tetraurelia]CAK76966.1 unnamed protein product [Paramecium tetraurelia]|eukprot:XP_001444363.1 hypothetical protein (macronuclear) [Paramecium tetraurelia strain d4-2]
MPNTSIVMVNQQKRSVQFSEQDTVHIVENWKEFNYIPKEIKIKGRKLKAEKIVIRTDLENYILEKYNRIKSTLKEFTNSCSFI